MSDFEDRSGVVSCPTDWGRWYQTVEDVTIEVLLEQGTRGKEITVNISPGNIFCAARGKVIFQGVLFDKVIEDESTWTIEDRNLLRILLVKSRTENHWVSLLENQYRPDPSTLLKIREKHHLQRYEMENPGFDFSGAKLDKKFDQDFVDPILDEQSDLQHLGAASLPLLSLGENKTDDEKLLEIQPQSSSTSSSASAALSTSTAASAAGSSAQTTDDMKNIEHGLLVGASGDGDGGTSSATASGAPRPDVTDDMKRDPSENAAKISPIVTDDMKNEQNESLETDEEKSGQ